jgi:hypothetical protein
MVRIPCLVLSLLLVSGCDLQAMFDRFIPKEYADFSTEFLSLFQKEDFAAIEKSLDPKLAGPGLRPRLEQMAGAFPKETPKSVRVLGSESFTRNDVTTVNMTVEYEYSRTWVLATLRFAKTNDTKVVTGANVRQIPESLEYTNRFALQGKSTRHYLMLAATILVPLFVVYALVLAIRTPIPKRKWLWIAFILLGVATFSLNWTTGAGNVVPVSVQLLGASFAKMGPAAPVVLSVSIPLGAIIFLMKRRRWIALAAQATQS